MSGCRQPPVRHVSTRELRFQFIDGVADGLHDEGIASAPRKKIELQRQTGFVALKRAKQQTGLILEVSPCVDLRPPIPVVGSEYRCLLLDPK
jgi:hypothetical protein